MVKYTLSNSLTATEPLGISDGVDGRQWVSSAAKPLAGGLCKYITSVWIGRDISAFGAGELITRRRIDKCVSVPCDISKLWAGRQTGSVNDGRLMTDGSW